MKDFLGKEILPGDFVFYCVRGSVFVHSRIGVVASVVPDGLFVYSTKTEDGELKLTKRLKLSNPSFVKISAVDVQQEIYDILAPAVHTKVPVAAGS